MQPCTGSWRARISYITRVDLNSGCVAVALSTNPSSILPQKEISSFLSRSPCLLQPELRQFNLFSIFRHELWMNPATSELRWSSSPGLYNGSCWWCRLRVDLKDLGRKKNEDNLQRITSTHPVSMPLSPPVTEPGLTVVWYNPLAVFIPASSHFW